MRWQPSTTRRQPSYLPFPSPLLTSPLTSPRCASPHPSRITPHLTPHLTHHFTHHLTHHLTHHITHHLTHHPNLASRRRASPSGPRPCRLFARLRDGGLLRRDAVRLARHPGAHAIWDMAPAQVSGCPRRWVGVPGFARELPFPLPPISSRGVHRSQHRPHVFGCRPAAGLWVLGFRG